MNRIKRHPVLFALLAVVVVVAIVLGVWAAVGSAKRASAPAVQATKAAAQTEVSQTLKQLKPRTKTLMSAVAPASASWWKFMQAFAPKWGLPVWDKLTGSPTSVGAAVFADPKNLDTSFPDYFGVPTVYLNYPSTAAAHAGLKQFSAAGESGDGTYQAFVSGSTLIVLPTYVFSDKIFANVQADSKTQATAAPDSALTRGAWQINWSAMDAYFKSSTSLANYLGYQNALVALGYNAKAEGSWAGYSTDTLHWTGSNFSETSDPVWDPAKSSYTKFSDTLNGTAITTTSDAPVPSGRPSKADDPNYSQYSTYVPQQALMLDYFGFATSTKVSGGVRDIETQKRAPLAKAAKKGQVRIAMSPSAWFGIMRYPDAMGFYNTIGFSTWTLDLLDNSNMNITVTY